MIRSLHRGLPKEVHAWKINARFSNGVADAWYSGPGGDAWVEYKYRPTTPTRPFQTGCSPLQRRWLTQRREEGRTVAVILGCPQGVTILTENEWAQEKITVDSWAPLSEAREWIIAKTL